MTQEILDKANTVVLNAETKHLNRLVKNVRKAGEDLDQLMLARELLDSELDRIEPLDYDEEDEILDRLDTGFDE